MNNNPNHNIITSFISNATRKAHNWNIETKYRQDYSGIIKEARTFYIQLVKHLTKQQKIEDYYSKFRPVAHLFDKIIDEDALVDRLVAFILPHGAKPVKTHGETLSDNENTDFESTKLDRAHKILLLRKKFASADGRTLEGVNKFILDAYNLELLDYYINFRLAFTEGRASMERLCGRLDEISDFLYQKKTNKCTSIQKSPPLQRVNSQQSTIGRCQKSKQDLSTCQKTQTLAKSRDKEDNHSPELMQPLKLFNFSGDTRHSHFFMDKSSLMSGSRFQQACMNSTNKRGRLSIDSHFGTQQGFVLNKQKRICYSRSGFSPLKQYSGGASVFHDYFTVVPTPESKRLSSSGISQLFNC